jgi:peptidyl-prolyl cis-trans isomerase SurA
MLQVAIDCACRVLTLMTPRFLRISAALVFGTALLASSTLAPAQSTAPQSPYGGVPVEEIVARVNDQIISLSDYNRAMKEMDDEARQHGATTMQEITAGHKDLLRSLIDQQLWLSKGKELGVTGETELVQRLDEIRKQNHLDSMEELEKAAKEQGVSFEDFKANVRNGLITQLVMRDEVGAKITITPLEAQRYYEQHLQDYTQPESVRLSEILVSAGASGGDDPAKLAAAKAKADDIEAKLHAGGDFAQLARSFSDGPTAAQGGDLGQYQHGQLAQVLEDKTFVLKAGEYTDPIHTRQGYVILKVVDHTAGGPAPFKEVKDQVEDALYMNRMEPAIRAYLTQMREEASIDIMPGYVDSGASANETKPIYSAYTPPKPKKRQKLKRTRYRESTHTFRQKSPQAAAAATPDEGKEEKKGKKAEAVNLASMKPGKKEKIRFGQSPRETLPAVPDARVEDAGALPETAANSEPDNPLLATAKPEVKTRFSARARTAKKPKSKSKQPQTDTLAPAAPDAAEVADRQTQSAPLGLGGDTASKKKKTTTTTGDKTRLSKRKKQQEQQQAPVITPAPTVPGAPGPARVPQQ